MVGTVGEAAAAAPRRMRKKGRETELKLLNAATSAFATWGYERVTMKDIGQIAGVTAATLYIYFADKDALYRAASVHSVSRSTARIIAGVADVHEPRAKLLRFVEMLAEVILDDKENTKLFERHMIGDETEVLADAVGSAFEQPFALLGELLEQVTGSTDKKDVAAVFALTLGLSKFSLMLETSRDSRIGLHEDSRQLARFVVEKLVPQALDGA